MKNICKCFGYLIVILLGLMFFTFWGSLITTAIVKFVFNIHVTIFGFVIFWIGLSLAMTGALFLLSVVNSVWDKIK